MTLEEQIEQDFMASMKSKDIIRKNFLSIIKGDIQTLKKNLKVQILPNDKTIELLNKIVKALKETIELTNDEKSKTNLIIISAYLPKQISEDEIKNIIIKSNSKNIGEVMKLFNGLNVDKKLVSKIYKELNG